MTVSPLDGSFGVEITGLDLTQGIDDALADRLSELVYEHKVVCIRDQALTPEQFAAFGRAFGEPVEHVEENLRLKDAPVIMSLANTDGRDDRQRNGGAFWHTDLVFTEEPASLTMLNAVVVPEDGGPTTFADQVAVYEVLPEATKEKLDGRIVRHCYEGRRDGSMPTVEHPAIRPHPVTGRKALYGATGTCLEIEGLPAEESAALLADLERLATSEPFLYMHRYRRNDLVIWDNSSTLHCGPTIDPAEGETAANARVMHRCSVRGWRVPKSAAA